MSRTRAFTLFELVAILSSILLILLLQIRADGVLHAPNFFQDVRNVECAGRQMGLYRAMFSYSTQFKGSFPIAGTADRENQGDARGFDTKLKRSTDPIQYTPDDLKNNVTASLWLLMKDKSAVASSFICPSTTDIEDTLTIDGLKDGKAASLAGTADFFARENLSYSTINMYHVQTGRRWSTNAGADWILMGDNNNATSADTDKLHKFTKLKPQAPNDVRDYENSLNHGKRGQNILASDSSVAFQTDPFVGPNFDNIYADDRAKELNADEAAGPPKLSVIYKQLNPDRNVVLLPLSGNAGVNLDPKCKIRKTTR